MKINVIIYVLIVLFSFILIHPFLFPIQEGIDDCLVNTLADLKIEVAELKLKVDSKSGSAPQTYSAEENGNYLLNNIGSLN